MKRVPHEFFPWSAGATASVLLAACATGATPTPARLPAPPLGASQPASATSPLEPAPEPVPTAPPRASLQATDPRCPEEMALVRRFQGAYCIDRWEASILQIAPDGGETPWPGNRPVDAIEKQVRAVSRAGQKPQGYISGEQAALACERSGKRLCEIDEWVRACKGSRLSIYPYGDQRRPKLCNDRYQVLDHHPVPILFKKHAPPGTDEKLMWHPSWMNDSRLHEMDHTITPTGAFPRCTNDYGLLDMVGNLHEWVADPDGSFFGGFFMDTYQNGQGCEYRTIAHPFDYHDYSTGFRCCSDPRADESSS